MYDDVLSGVGVIIIFIFDFEFDGEDIILIDDLVNVV